MHCQDQVVQTLYLNYSETLELRKNPSQANPPFFRCNILFCSINFYLDAPEQALCPLFRCIPLFGCPLVRCFTVLLPSVVFEQSMLFKIFLKSSEVSDILPMATIGQEHNFHKNHTKVYIERRPLKIGKWAYLTPAQTQ